MHSDTLSVILGIKEPSVREVFERAVVSIPGFEVRAAETSGPGHLLIAEAGDDFEGFLRRLVAVQAKNPAMDVFLTSERVDQAMLLKAMRAGVKEFFPQPVDEAEVRESLLRLLERRQRAGLDCQAPRGTVIDVVGTKGGVGTTTMAVNLGMAFLAGKAKTLLLDLNLPYGEVPLFLDVHPGHNWGEAIRNIDKVDASFFSGLVTSRGEGLDILPSPTSLDELGPAADMPEAMAKLVGLAREIYDVVIIDGGQYLDEVALKVMEHSDIILAVAVQNLPCLSNLKRFLHHLRQAGAIPKEKLRVVVNRHLEESDLTVADMEESLGRKIYWSVPNDYQATLTAINHGQPLAECAPKSPVTKSIHALAGALAPERLPREKKRGFWSLFPFLGGKRSGNVIKPRWTKQEAV